MDLHRSQSLWWAETTNVFGYESCRPSSQMVSLHDLLQLYDRGIFSREALANENMMREYLYVIVLLCRTLVQH